jgi:antirestriction protein ArdC
MSVYDAVTDRIIESLENGVIPWRREWQTSGKKSGLPYNLVSNKPYRGVNILTLFCSPYASRGWCTYKQAQALGYQVRKGEKAMPIVFWKFPTKAELVKNPDRKPFAKPYYVFNIEQLDGVPVELPLEAVAFDPIEECERVTADFMASASHPELKHGGDSAYFSQRLDTVQMPPRETFKSAGGYYATLFHEFAHSTGVKSRLARPEFVGGFTFGDENYSREELVAEFASAFLCAETGCSNEERIGNTVAYIQSWLKVFKNDKSVAIEAAQKAQRASDFILCRTFASESAGETEETEVAA